MRARMRLILALWFALLSGTGASEDSLALVILFAKHSARCWVHKMNLPAHHTGYWQISVRIGHVLSNKALHAVGRIRAAVEKWRHIPPDMIRAIRTLTLVVAVRVRSKIALT